jgi:translation initiation factor IF-2
VLGRVEVRQVFNIRGVGQIAGCYVVDGKIGTLTRFKDVAREVAAGSECGTSLENYSDVKVGDVIEPYEIEQVARRLNVPSKGAQAERTA